MTNSYTVSFISDYATMTTHVWCDGDEQEAERTAKSFVLSHYGWDMNDFATQEVLVERD